VLDCIETANAVLSFRVTPHFTSEPAAMFREDTMEFRGSIQSRQRVVFHLS